MAEGWLKIEHAVNGLKVECISREEATEIFYWVAATDGLFVTYKEAKQPNRKIPAPPAYCVTAMKELIGLRNPLVITPWHLYCALRKRGAQRMFDKSHLKENANGQPVQKTESAGT